MIPNVDYWHHNVFDYVPEEDWSEVDARFGLPDDGRIQHLARMMSQGHTGQHNETGKWPSDFRELGLYGERAFARVFGVRMDTAIKRFGNGRVGATLADGTRVDVMTRRVLRNRQLPDVTRRVKGHRKAADVVVLIVWSGTGWEPAFLGWLYDNEVKERGDIRSFQDGNPNYVVPNYLLNPMHLLMRMHNPGHALADENAYYTRQQPVVERVGPEIHQLELL